VGFDQLEAVFVCAVTTRHSKIAVAAAPKNNVNDAENINELLRAIQQSAAVGEIRITQHAHQEMIEEEISLADVIESIGSAQLLENYANHQRGACCLLSGMTDSHRPLHIVCTTNRSPLIVITAYEPKPPKWLSPERRNRPK
jgi:Domain of unknown function (DUF4258)